VLAGEPYTELGLIVSGLTGGVDATAGGCGAGETGAAFFFAADFFLATGAGVACFWMTSTGGS
jgi:hypothetical protein